MDKNTIDQYLLEYVNSIENLELKEAIKYSIFPGGKRLRPLLLLTTLKDLNIDYKLGIYSACAIEMIHSYSLIHDDLPAMDNDDLRRGLPTVHVKYGEAMAILAADALLTDSFQFFCKGNIEDKIKNKLVVLASKNAGSSGMVMGQVLDIKAVNKINKIEDLEKIHLHKTKDLINLAIIGGGLIANMSDSDLNLLEEFSYYFGLGFQIKDDINDLDKVSYPQIIGIEESKRILEEYKSKSLSIVKKLFDEKNLYQLVKRIL